MGYYRGQTVLGKSLDNRAMLASVDAYKLAMERIGCIDDPHDNRPMLASVNAYNQAIEKALSEKE
jgi:hypothetical protein